MNGGNAVAEEFIRVSVDQIQLNFRRIFHCLDQLSDEDIWWKPREEMNSIGTIICHLQGNLRQWILSGVGGAEDVRDRPSEFAERPPIPKAELEADFKCLIHELEQVVAKLDPALLPEVRRVQGFDETVLSAIYSTLTHLQGHAMQIVVLTRLRKGPAYELFWRPESAEQGAG